MAKIFGIEIKSFVDLVLRKATQEFLSENFKAFDNYKKIVKNKPEYNPRNFIIFCKIVEKVNLCYPLTGKYLREQRKKKSKSIQEVAKDLNISVSLIKLYETGKLFLSFYRIYVFSKYYRISADELFRIYIIEKNATYVEYYKKWVAKELEKRGIKEDDDDSTNKKIKKEKREVITYSIRGTGIVVSPSFSDFLSSFRITKSICKRLGFSIEAIRLLREGILFPKLSTLICLCNFFSTDPQLVFEGILRDKVIWQEKKMRLLFEIYKKKPTVAVTMQVRFTSKEKLFNGNKYGQWHFPKVAEVVKHFRNKVGISKLTFARKYKCSPDMLLDVERGERPPSACIIYHLSVLNNKDPDELFNLALEEKVQQCIKQYRKNFTNLLYKETELCTA